MSSAFIIETPLINFYYLFRIKYNIMFIKLIEESIYTGNQIVKLYYTNYNHFKTLKEWYTLYNISLLCSNNLNSKEIEASVFWCLLYQKCEKKIINKINTFYCLNSLEFFNYKPTFVMLQNIYECMILYIQREIDELEENINYVANYHKSIIMILHLQNTLKINNDVITIIIKKLL